LPLFHCASERIPLLGLVSLAKTKTSGRLLNGVIFRQSKKKARGRDADRILPIDLSITDGSGNPLLGLLFEKPDAYFNQERAAGGEAAWLSIGKKLCSHPRALGQVDLFAVNSDGQSVIGLLADTCRRVLPRRRP